MRRVTLRAAMLLFGLSCSQAFADIAVIVHPSNDNAMDQLTLERIYLGKLKEFPNGDLILPVNMLGESDEALEFNEKVLGRTMRQVRAYWSKRMFTGKGTPPREAETAEEVLALVSRNPGVVGYVDASKVTDKVKVVATY